MLTKTTLMSTPTTEMSVVSTVDEHGEPVDVVVLGSPSRVRSELAGRGWARFDTPDGARIYLHPRQPAHVSPAGLLDAA